MGDTLAVLGPQEQIAVLTGDGETVALTTDGPLGVQAEADDAGLVTLTVTTDVTEDITVLTAQGRTTLLLGQPLLLELPSGPPCDGGGSGSPGTPGRDGQPRFAGDGPPGLIIGAEPGDEYLDDTTGTIYRLV